MNLTVRIPEPLAARLAAAGVNPEPLVLAALSHAADELERGQHAVPAEPPRRTPAEAAARMRAARTGNVLPEGITIRDLLTHGRA